MTLARLDRQLPEATTQALAGQAWVVGRLVADGAVPTVALAAGVPADEVESLARELGATDVADGLEVVQLDAVATAEATSSWSEARLGSAGTS